MRFKQKTNTAPFATLPKIEEQTATKRKILDNNLTIYCSSNSTFLYVSNTYLKHAFALIALLFMNCESQSVVSSPTLNLQPETSVAPAPQNAFQRYKNIVDNTRSKKIQETSQNKQTGHNVPEVNKAVQPIQLIAEQSNVEHSRSRDKRKSNKPKKTNKPSKKGKELVSEVPTPLAQSEVSEKVEPSIHPPTEPIVQKAVAPQQGGIFVIQDHAGLLSTTQLEQYECGQIIDNEFIPATTIAEPSQENAFVVKPNLSMLKQPVYEGWQQNTHQAEKDKPIIQEHKFVQHKRYNEDNVEEHRTKHVYQNYVVNEPDYNERFEKKNYGNIDEKDWCYKSKICYEFLRGRCKKSANECTFAHGYDDLKHERKAKFLCRNYSRGFCKKSQEECKFYHEKPKQREYSQVSQNSSASDGQKRKERKGDLVSKKQDLKTDKREGIKQMRREERAQELKAERKEENKELKPEDRKNIRWSAEEKKAEQPQIRAEETRQDKKNGQFVDPNADVNSAYMTHIPYFQFSSGYIAPHQYPPQTKYGHGSQHMPNIPPPMPMPPYGFSSFAAPMYFSSFYPLPIQYPYFSPPHQNSTPPSFHKQQQMQHPAHFQAMPPSYPMHNYPPTFNQCYPYYPPPCYNYHQPNPHTVSNQTLQGPNSDNEHNLNNSVDEKRQKERYSSRQNKRNSSKEKSKDRKEKKHHRR